MITLKFYNNPNYYPDYSKTITEVGSALSVIPLSTSLKGGSLKVNVSYQVLMSANYISLTREGITTYGHIENFTQTDRNYFELEYSIDSFRTYSDKVVLGNQFIERWPEATNEFDDLLRGNDQLPEVTTTRYMVDGSKVNPNTRWLVIQLSKTDEVQPVSLSPVQPSPYNLYFRMYDITDSNSTQFIKDLMNTLKSSSRPSNLVSIYSIPHANILNNTNIVTTASTLPLVINGEVVQIGDVTSNFCFLINSGDIGSVVRTFSEPLVFDRSLLRTKHSVNLIIPEAGIISLPDEILFKTNVRLRTDVDLYTGSCNYMVVYDGADITPYSVRGGSISAVPIAYDPEQQLLAANRTSLSVGLMGDVASIVGGGAMAIMSGGIASGVGLAGVGSGITGIVSKLGGIQDSVNTHSNPPAFLGSALTANFNGVFYVTITKVKQDNATLVHSLYGYPVNQFKPLTIPNSGYIKTNNCSVSGNVPKWVKEDINNLFNNGLRIK